MSSNDQIILDQVLEQQRTERASHLAANKYFELFVAEQLLKHDDLSFDEIEPGLVDGGGDGGIDGFFVFVNGELVWEDTDLSGLKKDVVIETIVPGAPGPADRVRALPVSSRASPSQSGSPGRPSSADLLPEQARRKVRQQLPPHLPLVPPAVSANSTFTPRAHQHSAARRESCTPHEMYSSFKLRSTVQCLSAVATQLYSVRRSRGAMPGPLLLRDFRPRSATVPGARAAPAGSSPVGHQRKRPFDDRFVASQNPCP